MDVSPDVSSPGSLRRNTSGRTASPTESLREEMSENEAGRLQRVAEDDSRRSATILVRKKLPWLDTATTRPGPTVVKAPQISNDRSKAPEIPPLSAGRKRPAHIDIENTQQQIRPKQIESAYVSSDYSAGTLSDADTLPITLPKKDPASYEKLVDNVFEPGGRTPILHPGARRAAKTEQAGDKYGSRRAELVNGDMAHGTKKLKPSPSPYRATAAAPADTSQARRCKSCDTDYAMDEATRPRTLRHQKQDIAIAERKSSPREQAILNKPSTEAVLLPATSSSSSPDHLDPTQRSKKTEVAATHTGKSSGSLNRTVTGLENLMEEALNVARDAVKTGRSEAVAGVLNDATMALRQANSVQSNMHQRRSSVRDSQYVSDSEFDSESSHHRSHKVSAETLPTVYTKSTKSARQIQVKDHTSKRSLRMRDPDRNARKDRAAYSDDNSISLTPPRLYQPASAESIVRDFAYNGQETPKEVSPRTIYGAAASYHHDKGESVALQPGVRQSIPGVDKILPALPAEAHLPEKPVLSHHPALSTPGKHHRVHRAHLSRDADYDQVVLAAHKPDVESPLQRPLRKSTAPLPALPPELRQKLDQRQENRLQAEHTSHHVHSPAFMQSSYYSRDEKTSMGREAQFEQSPSSEEPVGKPTRHHLSLREGEKFSLAKHHKRQPIARE